MVKAAAIVTLVLATVPAKAAIDIGGARTVQDLYQSCKSTDDDTNTLGCLLYVRGVTDMLEVISATTNSYKAASPERLYMSPFVICGTPTGGQIRQAFLNWADKNPQDWQLPPAMGVWMAVRATWPCHDQ